MEGYRAWQDHYGPKPPYDDSYFRLFYTDFFFGDRSLVPGIWYSYTDAKLRPWFLQRYKQRLRQGVDQIARELDSTEYDEVPCADLKDRVVYELDASAGFERGKQKLQRILKAREYVKQTFQCDYPDGDAHKPY